MLDFPKSLHQLHIFEKEGGLYAADLDKAYLVEVSAVIVDILKRAETQTVEEITEILKTAYSDSDIEEAFETLIEYVGQGLLLNRGEKSDVLFSKKGDCPHFLLVVQGLAPDTVSDIENTSALSTII